ncbi:MAG: alkaline phosphatase family protein [Candidatus Pacearchaeota archaeon]
MNKILVILDGAADLPHPFLNGKTPLEAAEMPNLDFFSEYSCMGYMYPISENVAPGSDNSLLSIFGNNPEICKRGVLEAVGIGLNIKKGDIVFRTNFGTIENLKTRKVIDRRVGRTLSSNEAKILAKDINDKIKLPCKFLFVPTIQHRGVLLFSGGNFSENITSIDPEWNGDNLDKSQENYFNFCSSLDNSLSSNYTSFLVNEFISQVFDILNNHPLNFERIRKGLLPANMLFIRGGGTKVPKLKQYRNWMSINSMPLEIGISKLSGMKVFSFDYPKQKSMDSYKNLYEGLYKNIKFFIKVIKKNHNIFRGCYIHFKEPDIPGHDNKPNEKRKILEFIDNNFFSFLKKFSLKHKFNLVVTCDHATPCKLKSHSSDFVPVMVYDGKNTDGTFHFCETIAKEGILGKFYGKDFIKKTGLI